MPLPHSWAYLACHCCSSRNLQQSKMTWWLVFSVACTTPSSTVEVIQKRRFLVTIYPSSTFFSTLNIFSSYRKGIIVAMMCLALACVKISPPFIIFMYLYQGTVVVKWHVPHKNILSPVFATIWRGLGDLPLLEEVCHWEWTLRFQNSPCCLQVVFSASSLQF